MPAPAKLRLLEVQSSPTGERAWVDVLPARRRLAHCRVLLVAAAALCLVLAALVARARPVERFTTLVRVTVAPGDTLWALARRYGGPDCYLPKAVYQIRQANRLPDSRLVPGQVLWIPVERTRRRPPAGGVLLARSRQPQ